MSIKLCKQSAIGIGSALLCLVSSIAIAEPARPSLNALQFSILPGNRVQMHLELDKPFKGKVSGYVTHNPERIILDLPNVSNGLKENEGKINSTIVRDYQAVQTPDRMRLVLDLLEPANYQVKTVGDELFIIVNAEKAIDKKKKAKFLGGVEDPKAKRYALHSMDFRRADDNGAKVIMELSDPQIGVDVRQEGSRLIAEFQKTRAPKHLLRHYDVTDFDTLVEGLVIRQKKSKAQVIIDVDGAFEHMAYQTGNTFVIDVKPMLTDSSANQLRVPKYNGERLSLNFQDIEVRAVLQLLAEFTSINIVASDTVNGKITLRLQDVPWDQALDIILKTQGLAKRQVGNVMFVAPATEVATQERQELATQQQAEELAPVYSELIQVNYAQASDLAGLMNIEGSKLLSVRGSVSVDMRTNALWVQDTSAKLEKIRDFVKSFDKPVKQVMIEARVVNVDKTYEFELGVRFGITRPPHVSGTLNGASQLVNGTHYRALSVADRLNVDLPASDDAATFGLALATIGDGIMLDLELSALEDEGHARVVQSPRLVTSNQQPARIESGEEIPYLQASASGATNVAFKKAVLSLEVTPQITPDNRIILDLEVHQDTPGSDVLGAGSPPSIDTNNIQTQVLLKNGQTLVLGGIYKQDKRNGVKRVPFLGKLPIIGAFFRSTTEKDNRNELLIFITPRIMDDNLVMK